MRAGVREGCLAERARRRAAPVQRLRVVAEPDVGAPGGESVRLSLVVQGEVGALEDRVESAERRVRAVAAIVGQAQPELAACSRDAAYSRIAPITKPSFCWW